MSTETEDKSDPQPSTDGENTKTQPVTIFYEDVGFVQTKIASLNRVFDLAMKSPNAGSSLELKNIVEQIHNGQVKEADKALIEIINERRK